ncbi:TIGR03936 family radical SAM-associated protein [Saccharothrix coeruleofusca]|uniref:Radical SAM protein n=1 Tax=Saccharothrix coeruleofusca TaxID=33919 RepID=A0A918AI32_9PSEU|nr:TIGR03936 family radical SAM-associated protein [Saccharothrix coeruleofusca]MBP2334203.1 radical SAM-linked protein [Saccharothrix coeruleofusca]GGP42711.1 radical SAM protein [Saccharothrix coeruleofusca]
MQKLRLRYAKRGRLRFTSHRDVARTFERALRRAGVPMAYSQGFSPHPKVSWVGAAPTGVASEAEYVEVQVVEAVDPEALRVALDQALPPGLDVLEVVQAAGGNLPERVEASAWRIELPGVSPDRLSEAVAALLAAESVEVERLTKDGKRIVDVRPAVLSAEVSAQVTSASSDAEHDAPDLSRPCGILMTVVRQSTPTVRPDDVLSALRAVADLVPPVPAKATRMAQGRLDDEGRLVDPFAPDRAAEIGPGSGSGADGVVGDRT